jgi:hypothetical protein
MVWTYYKFARVEQNCGKQRQLKQLPDEMWIRKPMSGAPDSYPGLREPKHKVYGAADSQDVETTKRNSDVFVQASHNSQDGLGEFYD